MSLTVKYALSDSEVRIVCGIACCWRWSDTAESSNDEERAESRVITK